MSSDKNTSQSLDSNLTPPWLEAYTIHDVAPPFVPARPNRDWMDHFADRQPYRCLPLSMANSTGWEINCPFALDIEWTGGPNIEDIRLSSPDKQAYIEGLAVSHFRAGIVTFHTGYLFRTPPGWAVLCGGPPNWPKDGIYPLSGLVETDWLPYPFTMNWQMTRPGKVSFEKDEPFCFISLVEGPRLEATQPKVKALKANGPLHADYQSWTKSRAEFNAKLNLGDADAVEQGWQRHYMRGEKVSGGAVTAQHNTKRRMKTPKDLRGGAVLKR